MATKKKRGFSQYWKRREEGMCTRCGMIPPAEGRSRCDPCAEDDRTYSAIRYWRLRSQGKCKACGKQSGAAVHCENCARDWADYQRERREKKLVR